MIIGNKSFNDNRTYIMGILNVTPDSFSDGGRYSYVDAAVAHALKMEQEGADIIDIGGESTRPGHVKVTPEEEINRVCPVIKELKKVLKIPVSIDTSKSVVASAGITEGADFINDVCALSDKGMAQVILESDLPCCIMHNQKIMCEGDFWQEYLVQIEKMIENALANGICCDKIVIDPGIGFNKNYQENLIIINRLQELKKFGYPILLGTSRKSVIGLTLDLPVEERIEGTLSTSVIGVMKGCRFLRVHDVKANVRAVKMTEAVIYEGQDNNK